MKTLTILAASSLLVAGLASTAMAGDLFDISDANHDNVISMSEAQGTYNTLNIQLYNSADENGDGWLDEGEFFALGGLSAGIR